MSVNVPHTWTVRGGDGDDSYGSSWADLASRVTFNIDMGAGNDAVNETLGVSAGSLDYRLNLGDGDDAAAVALTFNGQAAAAPDARVSVTGGAGRDDIRTTESFVVNGGAAPSQAQPGVTTSVDCGPGDDLARVAVMVAGAPAVDGSAPPTFSAPLRTVVAGGTGNDNLYVNYSGTNVDEGTGEFPVLLTAPVTTLVDGGQGDDFIWFRSIQDYLLTEGSGLVDLTGGQGNDDVRANFTNDYTFTAASGPATPQPTVRVVLDGGLGNDDLEGDFSGMAVNGPVFVTAAGGDGDDRIGVRVDQPIYFHTGSLSIAVDGGRGNDAIDVASTNPEGDLDGSDRAYTNILVTGGDGDDQIHVRTGGFDQPPDPNLRLEWWIRVSGDAGNDRIDVETSNVLASGDGAYNGTFHLWIDGGDGQDAISADLAFADGSGGTVDVQLSGGRGDDQLFLQVGRFPAYLRGTSALTVDGGPGFDVAEVTGTAGIVTRACEVVRLL
jgi:hypothetical protein